MTDTANATLSAFFDKRHDAEKAARRLADAGIAQSRIHLMPGYESDGSHRDRAELHTGFFVALQDFMFPFDDRTRYAEGLSRGGYLVAVDDTTQADHQIALDILAKHGAIDLDEREDQWRVEGWEGPSLKADATDLASHSYSAENSLEPGNEAAPLRRRQGGTGAVRSYLRDERADPMAVEVDDTRGLNLRGSGTFDPK